MEEFDDVEKIKIKIYLYIYLIFQSIDQYHKKFQKYLDTVCAHVRRKYWILNMRKIKQSQRILFKDNVVKKGPRVRKKMYGVLFVCGVTRAIYPDYDYSTESVLHCIRRLMAERGCG